jgi:hypothetical protein
MCKQEALHASIGVFASHDGTRLAVRQKHNLDQSLNLCIPGALPDPACCVCRAQAPTLAT